MTQAYIYIRFSTLAQEDGNSRERQLEGALKLIAAKGWTLAETVEDPGKSAFKGEHMLSEGALGKFSERVRAGDIPPDSWLIAEKTDRLSREGWEVLFDWLRDMTRKGLNIITLDGHEFTAGSMRDQINVIKILLGGEADRQFSEKISGRVSDAYVANVTRGRTKDGRKLSKRCPGWMVLNDDGLEFSLIHERRDIVQRVYELAAEGRGARWIAKHLNANGFEPWGTKQNAQAGWDPNTIQLMLKSPAVEGDYVTGFSNPTKVKNKGMTIPGYFPRAVDADLVARARAAMQSRKWSGGSNTAKAHNLFRGLVKCGACGSRMYLNRNGDGSQFFQCSAAMANRSCEQKETFRYEEFETSALDTVLDLALDDRWFTKTDETHRFSVALAEAQKAVAEREARLNRAVDKMLDDDVGDVFAARIPELKKAVHDAKAVEGEAQVALLKARGLVSPAEHQRRVMQVRNAIAADDEAVRIEARLRVSVALAGIIDRIECHDTGEYGRSYWMTLLANSLHIVIGQDGVVWEQDIDRVFIDKDDISRLTQDPAEQKTLGDMVGRSGT